MSKTKKIKVKADLSRYFRLNCLKIDELLRQSSSAIDYRPDRLLICAKRPFWEADKICKLNCLLLQPIGNPYS